MNTDIKIKKIRDIIDKKGVGGVIVERQNNFSWLTGGRGFIGLASEAACGSVLITKDSAYLISNNIEIKRLLNEEAPGFKPLDFLWYEESKRADIIKEAAQGGEVLSDMQLAAEFLEMRTVLTGDEIKFFTEISVQSAQVLEDVVKNVKAGMSEFEFAGEISKGLWSLGIEPITMLYAFDERAFNYRHFPPTANKLKKYVIASICSRKGGLIVSATRCAHIGKTPDEIARKYDHLCGVYASLVNKMSPGESLPVLFEHIKAGYDKKYPGEADLHHQGGVTGYMAREIRAMPGVEYTVRSNQVYAWNLTITGTKIEDMILVKENGREIITHTGNFEYTTVDGVKIPKIINL